LNTAVTVFNLYDVVEPALPRSVLPSCLAMGAIAGRMQLLVMQVLAMRFAAGVTGVRL
jgi:hypothetical protein